MQFERCVGGGLAAALATVGLARTNAKRHGGYGRGDPRLKAGAVAKRDADTVVGDIVAADKEALAQRFAFDRRTGAAPSVQ